MLASAETFQHLPLHSVSVKPVDLTACRSSQSGALLCLVEFYPVKGRDGGIISPARRQLLSTLWPAPSTMSLYLRESVAETPCRCRSHADLCTRY